MFSDEGGFLVVGGQWRHGDSLYGHYWVDRPPLLIAIFELADRVGGLTGLRLIGCLAAAVTVLGVGVAARQVAGPRAAGWAAATACALLITPVAGALTVGGELLAAPFVAWGIVLTGRSLLRSDRSRWSAFAGGLCAVAAVFVKQNMLDVLVFAAVLGTLTMTRRLIPVEELLRRALWFAAGGVGGAVVILSAAALKGTSVWGVYFAMYPFRLRAALVIGQHPVGERLNRLETMMGEWASTGAPVLVIGFVALLLWRRFALGTRGSPAAVAITALLTYDAVSIAAGGSYWSHYTVQLVVPVALAAGLLATAWRHFGRPVVLLVALLCAVSWLGGLSLTAWAGGSVVGEAIGEVAQPADGIVTVLGESEVVKSSALSSPYRYLWSLPARTLDPGLNGLARTLSGPRAPGWVVLRDPQVVDDVDATAPVRVLLRDYRRVGVLCEHPVFVRRNLVRPVPVIAGGCGRPLVDWSSP